MIKLVYKIISVLLVFVGVSCQSGDSPIEDIPIRVDYEFYPIVTDMTSTSVIAFPDEINYECFVINSKEELIKCLPLEIINTDYRYESIDFDKQSILSIKYRIFYNIEDIEYAILNSDNKIEINQYINVVGNIVPNGYFVMNNLLVDKISDYSSINLRQSYTFDKK